MLFLLLSIDFKFNFLKLISNQASVELFSFSSHGSSLWECVVIMLKEIIGLLIPTHVEFL